MARIHLYVPDELEDRLRELPVELSLSEVFRRAVADLVDCDHAGPVRCLRCGAVHVPDAGRRR